MNADYHKHHRIAWAAGLFEGEGTIAYDSRGGIGTIRLQMNMTDEDVVRRFHEIVDVGTVTGPHNANSKNGIKPFWVWRCSTLGAISTLKLMMPYLGVRRTAKANEMLEERRKFVAEATAPRDCGHCGARFSPEYSQGARRRVYCSWQCKEDAHTARRVAA